MARIAIDARFYGTEHTGLGRYTTNVLSHLPKHLQGYTLKVLLRRKYYESLTLPGNCEKVLCDIPHYSLREQLILPLILKRLKPDLFYTFHFNTPIFSKVPAVVTVHDLIKSFFTGRETTTRAPWLYHLKRAGYNLDVRHSLVNASVVIVPTNTVKNQILANFPLVKPEHIHPIPEAPDPIFCRKALANLKFENLRFENFPNKYILFVGNAYPHKNLPVLLEAFKKLKDPSLSLVIVSKLSPFLSRTLAPYEPKNIHIMSELTDQELHTVYQNASVLVTPSLMEGYGLVGLEAMMLGVPVIASNIPVYREVYGDLVTYFEPTNSDQLSTAIKSVLADPAPVPLKFTRTWDDVSQSIAEVINASCARLRPAK